MYHINYRNANGLLAGRELGEAIRVRVAPEIRDRLQAIAQAYGITVSAAIRRLLEAALATRG